MSLGNREKRPKAKKKKKTSLRALIDRAFPAGFDDVDSGPGCTDLRGRGAGNKRPALTHAPPGLEGVFTLEVSSGTLTAMAGSVHIQH